MRSLFVRILGNFTWTPPPWISNLWRKATGGAATWVDWRQLLAGRFTRFLDWSKTHRRLLVLRGGTGLLTLAVLIGGSILFAHLPKPIKVDFSWEEPTVTKYGDETKVFPLIIKFEGSVAPLKMVGKTVARGISIKPKTDGAWSWQDDRTLRFLPRTDWGVGEEYRVEIERKGFVADHIRLAKYVFGLNSAPFRAGVEEMSFYQDPLDPKLKKVVATIGFSHPVDPSELEKRVSMFLGEKKEGLRILSERKYEKQFTYDKLKLKAFVHSAPIEIPEEDTYMRIALEAGVRSSLGGTPSEAADERREVVPGMYTFFRISSAGLSLAQNQEYETEQVLVIEMTNGVTAKELQPKLQAFLLPLYHPDSKPEDRKNPYAWRETEATGPEILRASQQMKLDPIETDREFATTHSFKYQADPGRYVYVRIPKGVPSFGGYLLAKEFDAIERVPEFPKELKILGNGSLLGLSGEKKISVMSRDIPAIQFEVAQILPDQIHHFVNFTSGTFQQPAFPFYYRSLEADAVTERFEEVREVPQPATGRPSYTAFDFSRYLAHGSGDRKGLFLLEVRAYDLARKRVTGGTEDRRFLLLTDLGLLVKDSQDGSHDVFVQSIRSGEPVAGASIRVLGTNGLPVHAVVTGPDGRGHFPSMRDLKRERQPVVYTAQLGSDLSFIPYDRSDRKQELSRFDIGGISERPNADSLSAYLFSDRGIYRPGDEVHLAMIVKARDWSGNLEGIPLEVTVDDARGVSVHKEKIRPGQNGLAEILHRTEETSPTGTYAVNVYVVKDERRGGLIGSTTFTVREFLPDEMRINSHFSEESLDGWVSPRDLKALVKLENLFGTPATDRKLSATISLAPRFPSFRKFTDYHFFDQNKVKEGVTERLSESQTDREGKAEFALDLGRFPEATYFLRFTVEGFVAEGGRSVTAESSTIVSPLSFMVGYKSDGDLSYISNKSRRSVHLIAVDSRLAKVAAPQLKYALIERRFVSVLTRQENGTYRYQSAEKKMTIAEKSLSIPAAGLSFPLPTNRPGDFTLSVLNKGGTVLNELNYTVAGTGNLTRSLEKNAELQLLLNKSDYDPGEEIEVQIKAPYVGAGLITIERDRVYQTKWFKTSTTTTIQRVRVPNDFEGNGYVSVSFVRDVGSHEIFMSPLSYGVVPFAVSRAKRTLEVAVRSAELAKPGQLYRMHYRANRPAKMIVFAVDEGILQVANYRTPDPLNYFFQKRALEVTTSQILDLIMPEYRFLTNRSAAGGDEGARAALGQNLNPFKHKADKAVVFWSGIVDAGPAERELSYTIPDYFNGSLRVLAVGVSPDAVGVVDRKALVRGDFVITPHAPTFVAPGDEFEVGVTVANNVEGSGAGAAITLDLSTSKELEVAGSASQSLKIDEMREQTAVFHVKAIKKPGAALLTLTATGNDKSTRRKIELSVRPSSPYLVTLAAGHLQNGTVEIPVPRKMFAEYRDLNVGVSPLPLAMAHGLIRYLEKFPYGCTEQLVSQAFPALILRKRPEFGGSPAKAEETLRKIFSTLQSRQNAEGAFGLWAANSHVNDFTHLYALQLLLEAREQSYAVPADVLLRATAYAKGLLSTEGRDLTAERTRAYAVYLLTRAGLVTTQYLSALERRLEVNDRNTWKKDLTAVYLAASHQMLRQTDEAYSLIREQKPGTSRTADYRNYYDGAIHDAELLFVLSKYFPDRLKQLAPAEIVAVADAVTRGSYNTLSSARLILAMDAYADAAGPVRMENTKLVERLPNKSSHPLVLPQTLFPSAAFSDQATAIQVSNEGVLPLFYVVTQSGFDLNPPQSVIQNKLEILREYTTKDGKPVSSVKVGDEIEAHVKIRTVAGGGYANVAAVDLLPGGFEVVMEKPAASTATSGYAPSGPSHQTAACENCEGDEGGGEFEEQGNDRGPEQTGYATWTPPIGSEKSTWHPEYLDVREDRVVLYGDADSAVKEFVYTLKATNAGHYSVPPAYAEGLYDRSVQAQSLGSTLSVSKD
ncbi:MAG: alpha-2-macroglobulin [Pseudomonadota bacterium]